MASRRTKTKLYDASDPLNIYSDPLHKLNSTKTEQGEDEDSNSTSRPWSANCASMQRQHISDYLLPIYYATVINVIHKAKIKCVWFPRDRNLGTIIELTPQFSLDVMRWPCSELSKLLVEQSWFLRVAIWWRLYTVRVLSDYMVRPKHGNPGDLSAV